MNGSGRGVDPRRSVETRGAPGGGVDGGGADVEPSGLAGGFPRFKPQRGRFAHDARAGARRRGRIAARHRAETRPRVFFNGRGGRRLLFRFRKVNQRPRRRPRFARPAATSGLATPRAAVARLAMIVLNGRGRRPRRRVDASPRNQHPNHHQSREPGLGPEEGAERTRVGGHGFQPILRQRRRSGYTLYRAVNRSCRQGCAG